MHGLSTLCCSIGLVTVGVAATATAADAPVTAFPLIREGLGSHQRTISRCSPLAQRYFDQGMSLYYGFARGAARRSFGEAEKLSPDCPMVHWAIALAYGPYINDPQLSVSAAEAAWAELQKAQALASTATPVEQSLIQALAARYTEKASGDRTALEAGFADAMRAVWHQYPTDSDVGVIFAEALMDMRPWDQWTAQGQPQPGTLETLATLEAVLALDVNHPYANHLYIHALEASSHPARALPESDRLLHLQPLLAHNVHMPSHIYIRVGRWQDAIQSNLDAVAAQHRFRALVGSGSNPDLVAYDAHNEHMLAFAAMMTGESALALEHVRAAQILMTPAYSQKNPDTADYFTTMPFEVMIRFGRWEEILAEPAPVANLPFAGAYRHAARAIALAAKGEIPEARKEQSAYTESVKRVSPDYYWGLIKTRTLAGLIPPMIEGEIDVREGKVKSGIAALREAVKIEDAFHYDEPPPWLVPVRHALGAALLSAGQLAEAEATYREDLTQFPNNGWALYGLSKTLSLEHRTAEAAVIAARFQQEWAKADVSIDASCLCQSPALAGPVR